MQTGLVADDVKLTQSKPQVFGYGLDTLLYINYIHSHDYKRTGRERERERKTVK